MDFTAEELWLFLPRGYLLTIAIEIPILFWGLSAGHTRRARLMAGLWLTACTYPVVVLVFPLTVGRWWGVLAYQAVAEIFAPVAECLLFRAAFPTSTSLGLALRDISAITLANLSSFLIGLWLVG